MTNSKWFGNEDADTIGELMRRIAQVEAHATDLERKVANFDSPQPISRVDPVTYLNPYEGQRAIDPADEQHMWFSDGEWRKAGGFAIYEIKVFADNIVNATGDDKFIWEIPEELDQAEIVKLEAFNTTAGSGATTVAIRRGTAGTAGSDILSTNITIDSGEYNSKDAATPYVFTGSQICTWGQHLHIDVNTIGSGSKGLGVIVILIPSNLASIVLEGAQGPPGGVTAWTGQWTTATNYTTNQAVSNNGISYVAIGDHTSGSISEPGVGANWEDFWMVLADGVGAAAFATATIDSSTRTLTATNTWEDVASATFTAVTGATYLVMPFLSWRWNSTNWQHHLVRAVVDGVTTGVTPTSVPLSISDNNPDNQTTFENSTPLFLVSGLAATAHTLKIQSADNNSGVDRVFGYTQIAIVLLSAQGPQGDPGGIINWTGQWSSGTSYVSDDAVSWKGSSYVARTASTAIEPGVTGGWATYWMVLAGLDVNSSIEVTLGDGVTPLTTGVKGYLELPFSGVIRSARMVADASGSAQVDIWRDSYANFPPVNADSITSTNELKLISAQKYEDVTLTGWSTSLTAGDWLAYNVDSATTVKQVTVSLVVERI